MRSARRRLRWLLALLPLVGLLAGCKKDDAKWGESIETEPVDVNALREKAKQKKQQPPAGAPAPTRGRP